MTPQHPERFHSCRENTLLRHALRIGAHWSGGALAVALLPWWAAILWIALTVLILASGARDFRRLDISSIQYEDA